MFVCVFLGLLLVVVGRACVCECVCGDGSGAACAVLEWPPRVGSSRLIVRLRDRSVGFVPKRKLNDSRDQLMVAVLTWWIPCSLTQRETDTDTDTDGVCVRVSVSVCHVVVVVVGAVVPVTAAVALIRDHDVRIVSDTAAQPPPSSSSSTTATTTTATATQHRSPYQHHNSFIHKHDNKSITNANILNDR